LHKLVLCEVDFEGVEDEFRERLCVLGRHVKQLEEELYQEVLHHEGGRLVDKERQQVLPEDGPDHDSQVDTQGRVLNMLENVSLNKLHQEKACLVVILNIRFWFVYSLVLAPMREIYPSVSEWS
jgi:hypothetical protein